MSATGVMAALDDSPRPGREPTITSQARTFVVDLACRKPKDFGYPHEVWTTRLLAEHVRERAVAAGYACLARLAQGTLCKILAAPEVKPHKLRYYLERRDPEFDAKMAEVVSVYREVEQLKQAASEETPAPTPAVAIISYDEKPGIQALANKAPDLPPKPMRHRTVARDHEYVRLGTQSLLAGIDLMTGVVHASVERRHRSCEFVKFLKKLDAAHPPATAIKLILDNHSAHKSKETMAWLAQQSKGRFTLVYTPKHGSWLNLVEGFFSKLARSVLRHIRVASLPELGQRILAEIDRINRRPPSNCRDRPGSRSAPTPARAPISRWNSRCIGRRTSTPPAASRRGSWSHATRGAPSARCCRWGDFDAARFVSRRFWAVGSTISRWACSAPASNGRTRPRSAAARGGGASESAHRRLHARKSALHLGRRAKSVGVAGRAAQPELCLFERPARFLQGDAEETSQQGPAARTDRTARAFAGLRRR